MEKDEEKKSKRYKKENRSKTQRGHAKMCGTDLAKHAFLLHPKSH